MTCRIFGSYPMSVEWTRVGGASLPSTATPLQPVKIDDYMVRDDSLVHGGREVFYVCDSVKLRKLKCIRFQTFHLFFLSVKWCGLEQT